ncbi:P-loop containing nucleoside triphosphate hydrolase protein, partial [Pseudoneurospora amorphoporcata]
MDVNEGISWAVWTTVLCLVCATAAWLWFYAPAGSGTAPSSPAKPASDSTRSTQRGVHLSQVNEDNGDTDIDIIAIHGLDAKSPDTWTWRDQRNPNGVNWLAEPELLPKEVGKARIFTCDWPADLLQPSDLVPKHDGEIVTLLIDGINRELLAKNKTRDRPILFIASCLGGIILMRALTTAADHECATSCYCLRKATRGIIFLATPFRGTSFQEVAHWADPGLTAWALIRDRKVSKLLDSVKGSTFDLEALVRKFTRVCQHPNRPFLVFNFYELGMTSLWRKIFPWLPTLFFKGKPLVGRSSATLDIVLEPLPLDRTHGLMNKFGSRNCEDYKKVAWKIKEFIGKIREGTPLAQADACYRVKFSLQGMPTSNNFVPRPSDITDIEKSLLPSHQKEQGCNVFVLHGLGGIGKTQLAVNFARQYQAAFSAIFWLDGTSEDSLKQSFASCAKRIPKDQIPENIRSPKTGNEVDLNDIVEHVQEWLAKDGNVDWLLIFDNVDLDYTQGEIPGAYDIRKYYLRSDHGAVLITSRLSKLAQLGESKRIKPADLDLSKKIFEKWYRKELMMDDDAKELLDSKLGGLPLALAQAAAYIGEADIPIAKYIDLYEKQWDKLLQNTDSDLLDYGNRSVWTTWMISFNAIETKDKNAGNLLRLWAFLDNREMWHSLLQAAKNDQEQWPKWLCDIACNEVKFLNIATLLLRYSMIETRESEQSSYSMHPVVHRWISHIQNDAGKRVFLRLAVMLIGFSVPYRTTKNYWVLQRRLLPHAERCLWWIGKLEGGECNIEDITIVHATHSLGDLYLDQGRLQEAETMYQRALEGREKALGPDHTSTLDTVNNLGLLYSDQGRLKEAETMYQRALEGKEKALGPDHTSTL